MTDSTLYPLGIQSFEKLRRNGYAYVDKTELIYQLTHTSSFYFLSRPRRFGKSLLTTTLEAYFKGQKELFQGLAIEKMEKEWKSYPVLHFDFTGEVYKNEGGLGKLLNDMLADWEQEYGIIDKRATLALRFKAVIRAAFEQTGQPVVILIDEYDKPLLETLEDDEVHLAYRRLLKGFFGVLKSQDAHIRFALITGVTRFSHVSIFSDLNNLKEISMDARYATLCGITQEELEDNFAKGVARLAKKRTHGDIQACYQQLRRMYDGYRFSEDAQEGVYNPYSLLRALASAAMRNYWFATGTPSFLFRRISQQGLSLPLLDHYAMPGAMLRGTDPDSAGVVALLYQSGYLTIENYDWDQDNFTLCFPNQEVRQSFIDGLMPFFFGASYVEHLSAPYFLQLLAQGKSQEFMEALYVFLAGISYQLMGEKEVYFQNSLFVFFSLLKVNQVRAEAPSYLGRSDLEVEQGSYIYLFELKVNQSAEVALAQIEKKGYAVHYAKDPRTLVKLGVNFSTVSNNISDCLIVANGQTVKMVEKDKMLVVEE